jgi:NADH-quinone oxidoreductase subunit J
LIIALCCSVLHFENPVYSVLSLLLVFLLAALLLLQLNVEFLAYTYIIVYVGAVVLLFVFVVFMIGPVYTKSYQKESRFFFRVFLLKFFVVFSAGVKDFLVLQNNQKIFIDYLSVNARYPNDIILVSEILYKGHFFLLWLVALILLLAMIAPIVFHFNHKKPVKH